MYQLVLTITQVMSSWQVRAFAYEDDGMGRRTLAAEAQYHLPLTDLEETHDVLTAVLSALQRSSVRLMWPSSDRPMPE